MNNKITKVLKKLDNKKEDLSKEYNKFRLKFESKRLDLSKEYDEIKKKYELKKEDFSKEYKKFKEKYEFKVDWKKIIWNKDREKELKKDKKSVLDSLFSVTVRELISFPFIWMMIIPAFFFRYMFVYISKYSY